MAKPIAITPGEPAGIGPDICIQLVATQPALANNLVLIADVELIAQRAETLGIKIPIEEYCKGDLIADAINVLPIALELHSKPGHPDPKNSPYVLEALNQAAAGCMAGDFSAMVTGPVQKSVINDAGIAFSGHTEYLAALGNKKHVVMMLATEGLRVALATTHLRLLDVPGAITAPLLTNILTILHKELQEKFGITSPRILVAGLNPHAGEDGHLGHEENDIIIPVLEQCRHAGMTLLGPLPADTLFTPKYLDHADAVLAMYHDQGLPVLKYKGFGEAVNITLGLPFIRTSVDHGTALDLAGSGKANTGSLQTAIQTAREMAVHWSKYASNK